MESLKIGIVSYMNVLGKSLNFSPKKSTNPVVNLLEFSYVNAAFRSFDVKTDDLVSLHS